MLSIKAFKSGGAVSKYYSHGDYYGNEGNGMWLGEGVKDLELIGSFSVKNNKIWDDIIDGKMPNGQFLGRMNEGERQHRAGIDLTFSAPKSFSIQTLVYANEEQKKELNDAFVSSVTNTLQYIEKRGYVIARKGKDGIMHEKIDKLTFAGFMHTTNRNLEPQMHMHCFLVNTGKCKDGKYRSLIYDKLFDNNKLVGQIFRNELALEVKKLGYDITSKTLSDGSSSFELSNIDQKVIDAFSTRRKEIVELCNILGVASKEGRDKIVINSRKSKKLVNEEELKEVWKNIENNIHKELSGKSKVYNTEVQASAISNKIKNLFNKFLKSVSGLKNSKNFQNSETKNNLLKLSIEDITYNKNVFSREELTKSFMSYNLGNLNISELDNEIKNLVKSKYLITNNDQYVTKEAVEKEKSILNYARNSIGKSVSIVSRNTIDYQIAKWEENNIKEKNHIKLNNNQKETLKHILTSKDKIITIEGLPGVGKSTVLDAVREIAISSSKRSIHKQYSFFGIAPTASAAKTLGDSAHVKYSTIHEFLGKYQGYIQGRGKNSIEDTRTEFKDKIIFVDEGSLISTKIMHSLLTLQEKLQFRILLTGDTKQLGAIEAGKPFEQILDIIKPARMTTIVRQNDESHKEAILDVSKGNIDKSWDIHKKNITEVDVSKNNKEANIDFQIANEAANRYLASTQEEQANTLLISPTRKIRDLINSLIRDKLKTKYQNYDTGDGLKNSTHINADCIELETLRRKDMNLNDYRFAARYKIGNIIKFHNNYKLCGTSINRNEYFTISKIETEKNIIILQSEDGKKELKYNLRTNVDYSKKFEIYNKHKLILKEGLNIVFTKNNRDLKLINTDVARVKNIDLNSKTVLLEFQKDYLKKIHMNDLKHTDYGYCITIHSSQGKTYKNTIAAIRHHRFLNNRKSWLVTLSRHKDKFEAIVDYKDDVKKYIIENKGDLISAIDFAYKQNGNIINTRKLPNNTLDDQNVNQNQFQKTMEIDI